MCARPYRMSSSSTGKGCAVSTRVPRLAPSFELRHQTCCWTRGSAERGCADRRLVRSMMGPWARSRISRRCGRPTGSASTRPASALPAGGIQRPPTRRARRRCAVIGRSAAGPAPAKPATRPTVRAVTAIPSAAGPYRAAQSLSARGSSPSSASSSPTSASGAATTRSMPAGVPSSPQTVSPASSAISPAAARSQGCRPRS